jgi:hypothetical protein
MSNSLAIAAVTATLRNLLHAGITSEPDLADASITMQPLDRARTNDSNANQLNLFLYHVVPSGAWRNQPIPGVVRSGETGFPALGLNLYYLLTAFGRDNDIQRPYSHQLMGRAMSVLNDHPLLGSAEIEAALPSNDLWAQPERVRITLQPFAIDEIAKLWTGFQTQYRLSVAYEAAVVLIESSRQVKTPVPVLMRGPADSGYVAQGNVSSPFPTLTAITPPNGQATASLGDRLTISGINLAGDKCQVQFSNTRLTSPFTVTTTTFTDEQVSVTIPNKPTAWPAGIYTVSVILQSKGQPDRTTNELTLAIAPKIANPLPIKAAFHASQITLKITCSPNVLPGQRVSLLVGSLEYPAGNITASISQLTFVIPSLAAGSYYVRLRVDGVDSQFIDRTTTPPQFDATHQVIITP